ncbi:hypothetical protein BD310DRAFT_321217 [Dichomitus squalens]|uniref:Uncharacterized protein n=1 Tax=Dichomitus squalens TaxID=114155 RepID=A0A4V2K8M0_9APHY|nr:hypothetical protein BD310DRAFT_321217 [Dichomitus squalens]
MCSHFLSLPCLGSYVLYLAVNIVVVCGSCPGFVVIQLCMCPETDYGDGTKVDPCLSMIEANGSHRHQRRAATLLHRVSRANTLQEGRAWPDILGPYLTTLPIRGDIMQESRTFQICNPIDLISKRMNPKSTDVNNSIAPMQRSEAESPRL